MKRRDFLKITPAAGMAFMLNGLPISTLASNPLLQALAKQTQANGRVLVLIQLNGGNDGLNMVIPIDQYSPLSAIRSNILIPQNKILSLSGTTLTGLHPAMTGIQQMYADGLVNIVQGVSYPDPSYSHFRATDIWLTGADSNQYLDTGWVGRYLEQEYSGYPQGYPNSTMPDPLAIQIGAGVSLGLQGPNINMGMAISDINSFYNIVSGTVDPAPNTPAGHELTFVRQVAQQTQQYTGVIQAAAGKAQNISTLYPAGNSLSDQLKIVARLIAGGLTTPVYVVSLGGFDTHSVQVDPNDKTLGNHATLLKKISEAVFAFFDDCKKLQVDDRVAAMTFSEFGRRVASNGSVGTDHGTAAPVMVFSPHVNPGIIGTNPVIPYGITPSYNLPMQSDFRSVYAAVLADWFQLPGQTVMDTLLQYYPVLPVFKKSTTINGNEDIIATGDDILKQNYPNPFSSSTTVTFATQGGLTTLQLFNVSGQLVRTVFNKQMERGTHQVTIDRAGMPAGNYFYRLTSGKDQHAKQLVITD